MRRLLPRRTKWSIVIVIFLLMFYPVPCTAQPVTPAKESSTKTLPADFSTSQKTYETYLRAIKANDLAAAKRCLHFSDGDPAGAGDVIAGLWVHAHHFSQLCRSKFGAKGWAVM